MVFPNGGERILGNYKLLIEWQPKQGTKYQAIALSTNGGTNFNYDILEKHECTDSSCTDNKCMASSYIWDVPSNINTEKAVIQVVSWDAQGNVSFDVSDRVFKISSSDGTENPVQLLSPNGGEEWAINSTQTIRWAIRNDFIRSKQAIALSTNGGSTFPLDIATSDQIASDSYSYNWTVPNTASTSTKIQVVAWDMANTLKFDISDKPFTAFNLVYKSSEKLVSPNGDEMLFGGYSMKVEWQPRQGAKRQALALSVDNGSHFDIDIASQLDEFTSSYIWNVPSGINSSMARLQIVSWDANNQVTFDVSDQPFTITSSNNGLPVQLISPNGGESLVSNSEVKIRWAVRSNFFVDKQSLALSTNNGTSYNYNIASTNQLSPSVLDFNWSVPGNIETETAVIKITGFAPDATAQSDVSDQAFYLGPQRFPVAIDPSGFPGSYTVANRILQGVNTVYLKPNSYTVQIDTDGFNFVLDASGNVGNISKEISAEAIAVNGQATNTIKFKSAAFNVTPGAYNGSYYLFGYPDGYTGQQMNFIAVKGLECYVSLFRGISGIKFTLNDSGLPVFDTSNSVAAHRENNTIVFNNVNVAINPENYNGQYYLSGFAAPLTGQQTVALVAGKVAQLSVGNHGQMFTPTTAGVSPATFTLNVSGQPITFALSVAP